MNDQDLLVIETMEKYGGSFIVALAGAARHADMYNLQKIKNTWHREWNEYVLMHEKLRYTKNAEIVLNQMEQHSYERNLG